MQDALNNLVPQVMSKLTKDLIDKVYNYMISEIKWPECWFNKILVIIPLPNRLDALLYKAAANHFETSKEPLKQYRATLYIYI